MKPV
jgi:hypothetical protein